MCCRRTGYEHDGLVLLLILLGLAVPDCEIDSPIGIWLKNSTNRSCEVVKGHFILDSRANSQAARIYKTFANLRRIEGCIYAKGYTGSTNLSFFSNLEEVVCHKTEAIAAKLENVIHVQEPNLYTMGFDSLRNVTGPGEIFLSFEEEQQSYMYVSNDRERYATEGRECFSKKEMIFLARHPQFIGKMYRACETDDPCFRVELLNEYYTLSDIPDNCTTFVGTVCLIGPYSEDYPLLNKFKSMTTVIGQLQVGGNLFDSLEIFSQLEVVYPYMDGSAYRPCYDLGFDLVYTHGVQPIHIGLNRFMKNIRLPSLLPLRPLEINEPAPVNSRTAIIDFEFIRANYYPDNIAKPCKQYPQFGKNCSNLGSLFSLVYNIGIGHQFSVDVIDKRAGEYVYEAWLFGAIFVCIGLLCGKRCVVFLFTRQLKNCLPTSQYLIATVILIMVTSAVESVLINQSAHKIAHWPLLEFYIFSSFTSIFLVYPFPLTVMKFLAVCRQTSLIIIILCYPDIILSYCWKCWNTKCSQLYVLVATIASFIAFLYFDSRLIIETRLIRPHYGDSDVTYIAFIMNLDGHQNFTIWLPSDSVITTQLGLIKFGELVVHENNVANYPGANDMHLEILGASFPQISAACDIIVVILAVVLFVLRMVNVTNLRHNFTILIILYVQMSMNRIRTFINDDILSDPRAEVLNGAHISFGELLFWDGKDEDNHWWVMVRIVEKFPCFSFMICSYFCWKCILYYRRLGLALIYRETKKDESGKLCLERNSNVSQLPRNLPSRDDRLNGLDSYCSLSTEAELTLWFNYPSLRAIRWATSGACFLVGCSDLLKRAHSLNFLSNNHNNRQSFAS